MRHIAVPEEGKAQIEDIAIHYFESDKKGNIAIRRDLIEIPANCARWAKAAMMLGFFEFFDKMVAPGEVGNEERIKLIESYKAELMRFETLIANSKAKLKAVESEAKQPSQ